MDKIEYTDRELAEELERRRFIKTYREPFGLKGCLLWFFGISFGLPALIVVILIMVSLILKIIDKLF